MNKLKVHTYTLYGSLGSDVKVILNVTFEAAEASDALNK